MQSILVGYDGSPHAKRAARYAADMAIGQAIEVRVIQVVPPLIIPGDLPAMTMPGMLEDQMAAAQKDVAALASELEGAGARVRGEVIRGVPATELMRLAEEGNVDLLVVGRTGKGALARALMGSVSSKLAHRFSKPLLIVP